jgi:hypothetical protein
MNKHERYRQKDLDGYRKRKREYARTPEQRAWRTTYMRGWRERNRERHNELARQSYERHKNDLGKSEERRRATLKPYGMSLGDYEMMFLWQGGRCAICYKPPSKNRSLHVDHDHETGEVRGLLCYSCNGRLGWIEQFQSTILDYLKLEVW